MNWEEIVAGIIMLIVAFISLLFIFGLGVMALGLGDLFDKFFRQRGDEIYHEYRRRKGYEK